MSSIANKFIRKCTCCNGETDPDCLDACACCCPCGTPGGIEGCDGRILYPINLSLSLTTVSGETEMWIEGIGMAGRLYGSQWGIDQFIAETDPGYYEPYLPRDHPANHPGVMIKVKSKWEVLGSTYELTDNTSVSCDVSHRGILVKRKALNGDEYVFDTLAGMPRLKNTVTLLETVRRSGNDYEGTVYENDGEFTYYNPGGITTEEYYIENNVYQDATLFDEADWNKWFDTTVTTNSHGITSFYTRVHYQNDTLGLPGLGVGQRILYRNNFYADHYDPPSGLPYERQSESHQVKVVGPIHSIPLTSGDGYHVVWPGDEATTDLVFPAPNVCEGDINSEYVDPFTSSFTFTPGSIDTPTGQYVAPRGRAYFTASSYVNKDPANDNYNFVTGIESVASVGTRSNPGAQDCDRCFNATIKITDGDTAVERIIWQGQLRQLMDSRLAVGEDPTMTRSGWTSLPIWHGESETHGEIYLSKDGKELWTAVIYQESNTPVFWYFKGTGDCPGSITEGLATVVDVYYVTSDGEGTPASPRVYTTSSRLKIDPLTLDISPMACDPCLEDPCEPSCDECEPELFNTGEEVTGTEDNHWLREVAEGFGTFMPMSILDNGLDGTTYVASGPDSQYGGITPAGHPWFGELKFRYELPLDCVPTEDITGLMVSDNECIALVVNGVVIATNLNTAANSYTEKHPFTIPVSALGLGMNTIDFVIFETGFNGAFLCEFNK